METKLEYTPLVARAFVEREAGEGGERKTRISVSSATACRNFVFDNEGMHVGNVILSHAPGAIKGEWIADGIVLRNKHGGEVVARGVDLVLEDEKLVARDVIWGASEAAKVIRADVESGVIREMSIEADYNPADVERTPEGTYIIKAWTPLAAAFVAVPADPTVGVNREFLAPPVAGAEQTEAEAVTAGAEDTAEAVTEIKRAKATMATTTPDTEGEALVEPTATIQVRDNSAELTREEVANYSVLRAVRSMVENRPELAKNERAVSNKLAKQQGKDPQGIYMPLCNLGRAFSTAANNGAGLVGTDLLAGEFIDILRNKMVIGNLGISYLTGLRGNVAIPKQTAAMSYYWVSEGVAVTESNPQVDQISVSPHTVGARAEITRKLMLQGSPDADALVQSDIYKALALALQDAVFNGTGADGQPLGIIGTSGVKTATIASSGSPTFPELCQFAGAIDQYFVTGGKWVLNNKTFAALRGTQRFANVPQTMAEIIGGRKYVADEEAFTTAQLAAGKAVYGEFDNVVVAMWGALDITVDPYTLAHTGSIRIVGLQDVDVAVRHPEAFVKTDDLPQGL